MVVLYVYGRSGLEKIKKYFCYRKNCLDKKKPYKVQNLFLFTKGFRKQELPL
jgi:hypothetical protein